jgi:hypothetical protein
MNGIHQDSSIKLSYRNRTCADMFDDKIKRGRGLAYFITVAGAFLLGYGFLLASNLTLRIRASNRTHCIWLSFE